MRPNQTTRGPLFGKLTQWLDIDFIRVFSEGWLSERQVLTLFKIVRDEIWFAAPEELIERVLGWRYISIGLNWTCDAMCCNPLPPPMITR